MSHQTGIVRSEALEQTFQTLRGVSPPVRALKVVIKNESMEESARTPVGGSFTDEYDSVVAPLLDEIDPCFILLRTDDFNPEGNSTWLLLSWVPDDAKVRDKMTYAATRATLKREFGVALVTEEVFGTVPSDILHEGFEKHLQSAAAPAPLTASEQEMKEIKSQETGSSIGASSKHEISGGMSFPVLDDARGAMNDLKNGSVNFIALSLDTKKEEIRLDVAENSTLGSIGTKIPKDSPRYLIIAYEHEHEGEAQRPLVFIYNCPGYACPVKERMCYSSCRNYVVQVAEELGLKIEKKLELGDIGELTEELISTELHPPPVEEKKRIVKAKAPGRGPRKLIR